MRYLTRRRRSASERARARAIRRWELDRQRRDALARASGPEKIVRRIVVIDRETTVREVTIYEHDSQRDARRKVREVMKGDQ